MEDLIKAIYETLSTDSALILLVPVAQIRRGWNEPVDYPTVRFSLSDRKPIGDDSNKNEIIDEILTVNCLSDGDLKLETIADAVINALKAKSLQRETVIVHLCRFMSDTRGTFFDSIRKKHRKDLVFQLIYSLLIS